MRALAITSLLLAVSCGPELDPLTLAPQKPFLFLSIDTTPPQGQPSDLTPAQFEFASSSTFAFDHLCHTSRALSLDARADAAPALQLTVASWTARGTNRWTIGCTDAEATCERQRLLVRWDTAEGRYDATLAPAGNGLATGSDCSAQVAADALDVSQVVVQGQCTNLLTTLSSPDGGATKFGVASITFRALCPRP